MLEMQSDPDGDSIDALADEFAQRCRGGGCPSITQYVTQYPDLAEEINEVFPAIAMMEQYSRKEEIERADSRRLLEIEKRLLDRLGDYRIVREIGRGGMGVVYEAIQESLGRTVALKVLTANVARAPKQLKRFTREAQAAAMLHHTNIVPIFGVGHNDGLHYYVMQYIDGNSLDRLIEQHNSSSSPRDPDDTVDEPPSVADKPATTLTWQQIADIGNQIAQAVDYAHHQGILHRDIKPANLLVDAHGTVWVTDFGLAKVFGDEGLTQSGDVLGTIRYMAPEQFAGESTQLSDVYSIGVTLYELVTGQPAFNDGDAKQLILSITQQGVPRPRLADKSLPRDLETIILKAAAFDPRHRYSTAGELADDLHRFCEGEPIAARRTSIPRRLWRWSCRNPALAAMSGISILLLLLVTIVTSVGLIRVNEARQRALKLVAREQQQAAELRIANQRVQDESDRAKEESQRAEDNLQLAMRAFEGVIGRVSSRGLPESLELELGDDAREVPPTLFTDDDAELLQSLLMFYEEFAQRNHADEGVRIETAKAHHRIGDIRLSLGQFDLAFSAYGEALNIYQNIAGDGTADIQLLMATVEVMNQRGVILVRTGRVREAIDFHLAAQDLLLHQPARVTETDDCRFALAETYNHLGAIWSRGDVTGIPMFRRGPMSRLDSMEDGDGRRVSILAWMEENYLTALKLLEELIAEDPANTKYRLALARCHRNCLPLAWHGGNIDKAAECLTASATILQQLVSDYPDTPRFAFELADTLSIDSATLQETEFGKTSWQRLEQAERISRELNSAFPNQPEYKTLYANALYRLGLILHRNGQTDLAERHLIESVKHFQELLHRFPSMPAYAASFGRVADDLGTMQRNAGLLERSRQTLDNAILRLIATYDPDADMRPARSFITLLQSNLNRTNAMLQQGQP